MLKDDLAQLLDLYRHWPCRILPNAFWKTANKIAQARLSINWDSRGELASITIQENSRILSLWCGESCFLNSRREDFERIQFALVHDD